MYAPAQVGVVVELLMTVLYSHQYSLVWSIYGFPFYTIDCDKSRTLAGTASFVGTLQSLIAEFRECLCLVTHTNCVRMLLMEILV